MENSLQNTLISEQRILRLGQTFFSAWCGMCLKRCDSCQGTGKF